MSNSCILATENEIKQKFNYMTAKLMKCNINNKYGFSSTVRRVPDYKRIEKDKREIKKRKKTVFILN